MLKIKDNLFMKNKIKCIKSRYSMLFDCKYLDVIFTDGSVETIYNTTIYDVIDLDRESDK